MNLTGETTAPSVRTPLKDNPPPPQKNAFDTPFHCLKSCPQLKGTALLWLTSSVPRGQWLCTLIIQHSASATLVFLCLPPRLLRSPASPPLRSLSSLILPSAGYKRYVSWIICSVLLNKSRLHSLWHVIYFGFVVSHKCWCPNSGLIATRPRSLWSPLWIKPSLDLINVLITSTNGQVRATRRWIHACWLTSAFLLVGG